MNKEKITKIVKDVKKSTKKHSPEILTGIGITGMLTTTVLAVKATPKALKLIEQEEKYIGDKLTKKEIVQTTWRCYIPATITGVASIACLVGASASNVKRNAALATAYAISETALKEYKNKVIETIGEDEERGIVEKTYKDKIAKNPVSNNNVIVTGKGDVLIYDVISGRYFNSDIDSLKRIENDINKRMLNDSFVSLNELYAEIGLDNISIGDELGWSIEGGFIEMRFSSQLNEDNSLCVVMDFATAPTYEYDH